MSGDSFRVMILRVESTDTVVANGGNSSRLCQPSSKAMRAIASYRPDTLDSVPRPRRRSRAMAMSGMPRSDIPPVGLVVSLPPAGAEGIDADGLRTTADGERTNDCDMAAI